jgi:putative alpha-1,2-mannosidase
MRRGRLPFLSLLMAAAPASAQTFDPAALVDPFVGTAGDHGQLTPAATSPYGMVQLAPDTDPAQHAGYDFRAPTLTGFSHTRAVGVGCGGGGGDLKIAVGYDGEDRWALDKRSEAAAPGWYHVRYGAAGIEVDLTADGASGISRFRLPHGGVVSVTLDPRHSYTKRISAEWESRSASDLRGQLVAGTVCDEGAYRIAFASALLLNGQAVQVPALAEPGDKLRFRIAVRAGDWLELRTGLSVVDSASAAATARAALGGRTFDQVRARTRAAWNKSLGVVRVDGRSERQRLLYTHLFRVMQMPAQIDDPAGRFRGSDGKLDRVATGRHRYSGWAVWDNYRTQLPLIGLLEPTRANDIAASLAGLYLTGKVQWATRTEPFITVRTEHAGVALLDYWRKGIRGFDAPRVLPLMAREIATLPNAAPDQQIETAYDAWAVSELAGDLGQRDLQTEFRGKALAYRPTWQRVFRDLGTDADMVKARGLYQGTLWQYRWAPVFDLEWVRSTALGPDRFDRELKRFFDDKLFNMTNQPDIQAPFLFAATGDSGRTSAIVEAILNRPIDHWYANEGKRKAAWHGRSFQLDPVGYADGMDDDAGGMAAWYVWASLGLYPLVPGRPDYVVTVPNVARSVIAVGGGRTLTIQRRGSGQAIRSVTFDGRRVEGTTINHARLVGGGVLTITTS